MMNLLPKFKRDFSYLTFPHLLGASLFMILSFSVFLGTSQLDRGLGTAMFKTSYARNFDLKDLKTYQNQNLPVGDVKFYPAPNSWGTVLFVPQYHRSPGSNVQDKANDQGALSQDQNYKILKFLINNAGGNIVMVEGSPQGYVPSDKIAALSDKIKKRDDLRLSIQNLEAALKQDRINPLLQNNLLNNLDIEIHKVDREIILEGAAENLKAEGGNFKLYGSENPETNKESKIVLRDYLYLQDRINQLKSTSSTNLSPSDSGKNESTHDLTVGVSSLDRTSSDTGKPTTSQSGFSRDKEQRLLLSLLMNKSTNPEFAPLKKEAQLMGKENLVNLIKTTEDNYHNLDKNTPKTIMLASSTDTPSWNDNPYKSETDINFLEGKLSEAKQRMEDVIVNKRNMDTAQNLAQILKNEKQSMGVLQFGAGHENGLIKALNSQGLSVIEVKSDLVTSVNTLS